MTVSGEIYTYSNWKGFPPFVQQWLYHLSFFTRLLNPELNIASVGIGMATGLHGSGHLSLLVSWFVSQVGALTQNGSLA